MDELKIAVIILIIVVAYSFFTNKTKGNKTYSIPPEYMGQEGLNYIKQNYASQLSQARSLCSSQFKGNWIDTSNSIGCYNMQGFSSLYCSTDVIKNLIETCNSIGGISSCSSSQISCTVQLCLNHFLTLFRIVTLQTQVVPLLDLPVFKGNSTFLAILLFFHENNQLHKQLKSYSSHQPKQ